MWGITFQLYSGGNPTNLIFLKSSLTIRWVMVPAVLLDLVTAFR